MEIRSVGTSGSGPGQFNYPHGIAVDGEGNVLVADNDNHRIQQFTAEGQFVTSVRKLTFNHSNNKDSQHRVTVLNSDLSFFSLFGEYGSGKGQLDYIYPCDVVCDSTGKVCVADHDSHRIQVFTAEGKSSKMFMFGI